MDVIEIMFKGQWGIWENRMEAGLTFITWISQFCLNCVSVFV